MAKFQVGDMWEAFSDADHFIVCCSSTVDSNGHAILKEGMAKELDERFPFEFLPVTIGRFITDTVGVHGVFGLRSSTKVGLLQDKRYQGEPLDLMCSSVAFIMLTKEANMHPDKKYHVEMPNHDGKYWLIRTMVERCPDNVTFWSKPEGA